MKPTRLRLHYLSGTGNTRRVALWLKDEAERQGIPALASPVEDRESWLTEPEPNELVGILTPTHGFTIPWLLFKLLPVLPRGRGTKAFAVATRAGMYATDFGRGDGRGRFRIPGLSASATFVLALFLWLKGYRVCGLLSVDMPSNWMALHPPLRRRWVSLLLEMAQRRTRRVGRKLLAGRAHRMSGDNVWEFLVGLALAPISLAYLAVGHVGLAKLFVADPRCNGCGLCARHCPVGAITMVGRKNPRPYWTWACESCMRCMAFCPRGAVQANQAFAIPAFWLAFLPISSLGVAALAAWLPDWDPSSRTLLAWLLLVLWSTPVIVLSYLVLQLLSRTPGLCHLVAWTTFTRLYGRYREPNTRLRDLPGRRTASTRQTDGESANR